MLIHLVSGTAMGCLYLLIQEGLWPYADISQIQQDCKSYQKVRRVIHGTDTIGGCSCMLHLVLSSYLASYDKDCCSSRISTFVQQSACVHGGTLHVHKVLRMHGGMLVFLYPPICIKYKFSGCVWDNANLTWYNIRVKWVMLFLPKPFMTGRYLPLNCGWEKWVVDS